MVGLVINSVTSFQLCHISPYTNSHINYCHFEYIGHLSYYNYIILIS